MKAASILLRNVNKTEQGENLLDQVNLTLTRGKIHAIIGDHGSGKTLLTKVLSGQTKFNDGFISINGTVHTKYTFKNLRKLPIQVVPQDTTLLDNLTVAHNLLIPEIVDCWLTFRSKIMYKRAQSYLDSYSIKIDSKTLLANLNSSERQLIAVLRTVTKNPDIIILDSPFDLLTAAHTELAKDILKQKKNENKTIVYLTNRIEYLDNFADTVSILKHGHVIWSSPIVDIDRMNIVKMCYTEIALSDENLNSNKEIYELFKFNEAILHNLPIMIVVADQNYTIKMLNKMAKSFFGLEEGNNISLESFLMESNKNLWEEIRGFFQSDEIQEIYNIKFHFKGQVYTLNIKCFPVSDAVNIIGHMLLVQDISRQENLREQVVLSEKLASVGLLAAGVAHEINNPLEIVYNIISYLKFNTKEEEYIKLLDDLEDEVTQIKKIVSNLISFSETKKNQTEVFNLDFLLQKLVNLIHFNAKKQNINIKTSCSDKIIINADKSEIRQVLLNLFKNSIEAMPDGGTITIDVNRVEENGLKWCRVTFQDTGNGIDENIIKNIFLPFYSTKTMPGTNMGLGLSISFGIIQKHNGIMEVQNLEQGCKFTIKLPLQDY